MAIAFEMDPCRMELEGKMKMRRPLSTIAVASLAGGALGLCLAAAPAYAQATSPTPQATSTFTLQTSGTVSWPTGAAAPSSTMIPEKVDCSGAVKVITTAVMRRTLPPGVVVSIDTRELSCVGQTTKAAYVNTGQANLTRLLVPNDLIETTFAFHPNVPGGYLDARTALLTLNLSFDTTTGALKSAVASIGNYR
jgi:hypothetical protein